MILKLKKNSNGKFLPATNEEIGEAFAIKGVISKKHNEPNSTQSVLLTAIEGANEAKDVKLEEMGL